MAAPPPFNRNGSSVVVFEGARRNANPLGALQTGGRKTYDFEGSVRADPPSTQRATGLSRTGVSRLPIVRWYHGELSGELALREVLDAVEACVGAEYRERRELVDAVRLYGQIEDVLGGPVGAAVGGVPLSPLTVSAKSPPVAAGLWATIFSHPPEVAMRTALAWVTGADADEQRAAAAGAVSLASLRKALSALAAEEANLEFKRACLASHPKRPGGRLHEHVATHVQFELVRHCWESSHPALYAVPRAGSARDVLAAAAGTDGDDAGCSEAANDALAEAAVRTCLEYDLKLTDAKLLARPAGAAAGAPAAAAGTAGAGAPPPPPVPRALVPPLPAGMSVKEYNARVERYLSHLCAVRDELTDEVDRLQHSGAFATLGADPSATTAELTRQYRNQAKRLHPDRHGGDKRAFQELQQAYETIMKERAAHDGDGDGSGSDEDDGGHGGGGGGGGGGDGEAAGNGGKEGGKPSDKERAKDGAKAKSTKDSGPQDGGGAPHDGADGADQNLPPNGGGATAAAADAPEGKQGAGAPAGDDEIDPALADDPALAELLATLRAGKADADAAASRASSRQGARPKPADPELPGRADGTQRPAADARARAAGAGGARARARAGARGDGADAGGDGEGDGDGDGDGDASTDGVYIGGVRAPASLPTEAASEHAELSAEHASMCTRSSKIAASVAQASKAGGTGGSSVLLSAAGLILDCAEKSATHARRAGSAAASAPAAVMPTLHGLCATQLSSREEKAVRKLMAVVLGAAAAGEASLEAVAELELSTGKNVRESLALMRAHASTPVANVAGPLAAQMLGQVGKAAVRCAEQAMAAAMALADLQHRIDKVFTPPEGGGSASRKPPKPKRKKSRAGAAGKGNGGADGGDSDDGADGGADGKGHGAKEKKGEAGSDEERGEDAGGTKGKGKDKDSADAAGANAGADHEAAPQNADERRLLENRQLLLKLNAQVVQSQLKVKSLLAASPGLIVAVSEAQKEALFSLLAEAIGDAESRLARKWYEAGCGARLSVPEWTRLVLELTAFVSHGANAEKVAVPYALSGRLLREAALVDNELLCAMVRRELFDKVLLLSPDARGPEDEEMLRKLSLSFDQTIRRLKLSANGVSV